MKVLHTYCLNYNLGDYYLGIGVKNLLRSNLNIDLIAETNLQGRIFNEYYINEVVNKKYDLLVIGGGGIIHGSHWPNGWFWLISEDLISQIRIPYIVYGVGYNYWIEEGGMPEHGKVHLRKAINNSSYFSVRNDGSHKRLLNQIGINLPVVPDPGFHINLNKTYKRKEDQKYILVQLAYDKPINRFGSLEKIDKFISIMREITADLSTRYKVIFAPHVFDDIELSKKICFDIPNTCVWDFGLYAFDNVEESLGYYQFAEFVIAMRGHGQIIPIAFNTPVIALENHPKHRGLMEELQLLEYNVKIDDINFQSNLKIAIEKVENETLHLKQHYIEINKNLYSATSNQWELIKQKING